MRIDLRLQHDLLAIETEHDIHAMIEITGDPLPEDAERTPLDLAVVIDKSGSMRGEPLAVVKSAAQYLLQRLAPSDRLAVVAYDNAAELIAPLLPAGDPSLPYAIDSIQTGGMTNLSGGWLKGEEQLRTTPARSAETLTGLLDPPSVESDGRPRARRILLLTDGLANQGITDSRQLCSLAAKASAAGIGTTTIGVGDGFNEELLTQMADAANGNSYYAELLDDAPKIFADEFDGLSSLAAQNVSVEIRPNNNVEVIGVLGDRPTVAVPGGVQVQLGDAYAGHVSRLLFKLHVPNVAALGAIQIAEIVVRYVSLAGEEIAAHDATYPLMVNLVSSDDASLEADPVVTEEITILAASEVADEAMFQADRGDLDGARRKLTTVIEQLRLLAPASDRGDELLRKADSLGETARSLRDNKFDAADRKRMYYRANEMKRDR